MGLLWVSPLIQSLCHWPTLLHVAVVRIGMRYRPGRNNVTAEEDTLLANRLQPLRRRL